MLNAKMWSRVALTVLATGLLVTPVAAKVYSCSQSITICGVDLRGCLSSSLGSRCTTKCYTDSATRICTSVSSCKVWNRCARQCTYENQGCSIRDAISNKLHTCTSDIQICCRPTSWNRKLLCWDRCTCTLTCCYNPSNG